MAAPLAASEAMASSIRAVSHRRAGGRRVHASPEATRLDRTLAALSRARGPARRVLAALAARLVATRGWERLGYARLADYAREGLGLAARTVQDLAHVDAALGRLPPLGAALAAGRLSWTKVRLVARVASPGDVQAWVAFAEARSARMLAREVRRVDHGTLARLGRTPPAETDEEGVPVERRERVALRCSPRTLALWNSARHHAARMAGEPVPKWQALESVAAEALSAIGLGAGIEDPGDAMSMAAAPVPAAANACATHGSRRERAATSKFAAGPSAPDPAGLPPDLARLARGLDGEDAFGLDARLRRVLAFEQGLEARTAPLLRELAESRCHRELGFASLAEYVPERLGMSPRRARALLRIERSAGRCSALREGWHAATLSWVQADTLAGLVPGIPPALASAWVAHAGRVSVRRLQEEIEAARCGAAPPEVPALRPGERQTGARSTQCESLPRTEHVLVWCPRDVASLFRAVLCSVRKRLERPLARTPDEGEAFEAMLLHALGVWCLPQRNPRLSRVFERDGWRCTVPGCTSMRNLQDHHVVFRSHGGSDALANRTTLCAWHHLRGVHGGLVGCTGSAPHGLRFELGVRPSGPPHAIYSAGDVREGPRHRPA